MGGDFIGSHLVELSTGFDFLKATIDVSLGNFTFDKYACPKKNEFSGVYFLSGQQGKIVEIVDNADHFSEVVHCEMLCKIGDIVDGIVDGSDKRIGLFVYSSVQSNPIDDLSKVLTVKTT